MTAARRALLLDDEPLVQSVIQRFLKRLNFTVDCVGDPTTCIAQFSERLTQAAKYDVVFLDLNIDERVTGLQVFHRLREIDPNVRAIAVSGASQNPVLLDPAGHGFAAAMAKPFSAQDLDRTLHQIGLGGCSNGSPPTLEFDGF